jgi:hypothetical protein
MTSMVLTKYYVKTQIIVRQQSLYLIIMESTGGSPLDKMLATVILLPPCNTYADRYFYPTVVTCACS